MIHFLLILPLLSFAAPPVDPYHKMDEDCAQLKDALHGGTLKHDPGRVALDKLIAAYKAHTALTKCDQKSRGRKECYAYKAVGGCIANINHIEYGIGKKGEKIKGVFEMIDENCRKMTKSRSEDNSKSLARMRSRFIRYRNNYHCTTDPLNYKCRGYEEAFQCLDKVMSLD